MKATREELEQRRRDLQQRLARQEHQRNVDDALRWLRDAGAVFDVLDKHDNRGASLLALFPCAFITIDWREVPGARELEWFSDDDRAEALLEALGHNGVTDDDTVLVFEWACGPGIQVRMRLSEVRKHAKLLLAMDMDSHCWRPGERWVIEVHHDHRVTWGFAPSDDPRVFP